MLVKHRIFIGGGVFRYSLNGLKVPVGEFGRLGSSVMRLEQGRDGIVRAATRLPVQNIDSLAV